MLVIDPVGFIGIGWFRLTRSNHSAAGIRTRWDHNAIS